MKTLEQGFEECYEAAKARLQQGDQLEAVHLVSAYLREMQPYNNAAADPRTRGLLSRLMSQDNELALRALDSIREIVREHDQFKRTSRRS